MAKMIDVLRETVSPAIEGRVTREIGNSLYVILDEDRRIGISFETAGVSGNYEVLLLKLTSKARGELHRQGVKFKDLLGVGKLVSDDYKGGYSWRGANKEDLRKVRMTVSE